MTTGIYSPTTVTIRCATGRTLDLELTGDDILRVLTAPAFMDRVETLIPGRLDEAQRGVRALEIAVADGFLDRYWRVSRSENVSGRGRRTVGP